MSLPKIVIVGGGFGGLAAATKLAKQQVDLTLIDRANHHVFQPLLYQVATGGLSPANIATPLRSLFRGRENVQVLQGEVESVDFAARKVQVAGGSLQYDYLVLAAGGRTSYFDNPQWSENAVGLKTLTDATTLRERVFAALERAERDPEIGLPTFLIAGAGPTGVEMAGAVAELTRHTVAGEFRRIDPSQCPVVLADPGDRPLTGYPAELGDRARTRLEQMGVRVRLGAKLTDVDESSATIEDESGATTIQPVVTVWAAGVSASGLAERLPLEQENYGTGGRLRVESDLRLPGRERVFVVGDLAEFLGDEGKTLPGVAPVAIQQGKHAAANLLRLIRGRPTKPFCYRDFGSMAVIGRGAAVADLRGLHLSGYPAWIAWLFIHLLQLVGYQNRLLVAMQWGWNYLTRNRSARLIVSSDAVAANDKK